MKAAFALALAITALPEAVICLSPYDFDKFLFNLVNQGGFCKGPSNTCRTWGIGPSNPPWTIRGLWPSRDGVAKPVYCRNSTFNIDDIASISDDLDFFWPDYSDSTSDEQNWAQEFAMHGSCAVIQQKDLHSTNSYFSKALALYRRYNVIEWLDAARIMPSNSTTISRSSFLAAFRGKFDGTVMLHCDHALRNGSAILQEIRLCLNRDYDPAICGKDTSTCRTGQLWYLDNSGITSLAPSVLFVTASTVIGLLISKLST